MSPSRIGLIYGVGAFVFFAVVMNTAMLGWATWYQLVTHGAHADARVTRLDLPNHSTCYFEYIVNSHRYESSDQGCDARIGEIVPVTYSAARPTLVTIASPKEELAVEVLGAVALSVIVGIGAAFQATKHARRRA